MADSVGGAIARGLQTGLQIGTGLVDRQRQREAQDEDRAYLRQQRQQAQEDRGRKLELDDEDRMLKTLDAQDAQYKNEISTLLSRYKKYEAIPQEELTRVTRGAEDVRRRRDEINERRMRPLIEKERREGEQLFADLKTGKVDGSTVDPSQLYRAVMAVTGRDPMDFLRQGGQSPIGQAINGVISNFENPGTEEDMLSAVNTILAPELNRGVGTPGRDGSEIIKKEVARLLPDPKDKTKFLPVLKVTVRRADGATGSYLAPVTKGRSASKDDDEVTSVGVDRAMDYVGHLGMMEELLNAPGVVDKIVEGAKAQGANGKELLSMISRYGLSEPKRKVRGVTIPQGNQQTRVYEDEATGEPVRKDVYPMGINPNTQTTVNARVAAGNRPRGIQLTVAEIDRMVEDGDITEEEGVEMKRQALVRPRGAAASDKPMSEKEREQASRNAEAEAAKGFGLQWNADRKTYVTAEGKKATAEQLAQIAKAGADALNRTRSLTREGRAFPPAPMDPGQRKAGQTYMTPKGPMIWRGQGWEPAGAAK